MDHGSIFLNVFLKFCNIFEVGAFLKKLIFHTRKMKNGFFCAMKRKTFFINIACASKIHICVEYGNIWTNYAMDVAITPVIWTES